MRRLLPILILFSLGMLATWVIANVFQDVAAVQQEEQ